MTSLDAVRAALRNQGLPFADILTEDQHPESS